MFGDMMGKLQQMRQRNDELKQRLENITVTGEAPGGLVKVIANGNRKITNVKISGELLTGSGEELEKLIKIAVNNSLEQAEKINEAEMQSLAKDFLPGGFPGLK